MELLTDARKAPHPALVGLQRLHVSGLAVVGIGAVVLVVLAVLSGRAFGYW